jgi:putative membrane protein
MVRVATKIPQGSAFNRIWRRCGPATGQAYREGDPMRRLLATCIVNCAGIALAAAIIPSISFHGRVETLIVAGLILALVNFALRPLVILLTLPAVILSLGVALVLINALMLWLTSRIVTHFHVGGFWSTVGGAVVLSFVNLALKPWTRPSREGRSRPAANPRARRG